VEEEEVEGRAWVGGWGGKRRKGGWLNHVKSNDKKIL
jgi:hypothetical protein